MGSPVADSQVRPIELSGDLEQAPNLSGNAWTGQESNSFSSQASVPTSPPPPNPDSVSSVREIPGQLMALDESSKPGPLLGTSSVPAPAMTGSRPSSADKIRPTTAGPKRDSK